MPDSISDKIPVEEPPEVFHILFGDRYAHFTEDNAAAFDDFHGLKIDNI